MFAQSPAGEFSLRGQVVFSDGAPISDAEINLDSDDVTLSDEAGRFEFPHLKNGSYGLSAWRSDIGYHTFGQKPTLIEKETLNVNAKFPHQDVRFVIERPGVITGVVRDFHGQVSPDATINLRRERWSAGRPTLAPMTITHADDRGRFRLPFLMRGRYQVCAENTAETEDPPVGMATYGATARPVVADRACYPESGGIVIAPGAGLEVELRMAPVYPATVAVKVAGAPKEGLGVRLEEERNPGVMRSPTVKDNEYNFSVPPGRYLLKAEGSAVSGRMALDVGSGATNSVELPVGTRPKVRVVVHAPGVAPVAVSAMDALEWSDYQIPTEASPDGGQVLNLPYPGRYWIVTRTEYCPVAASYGTQPALFSAIDVEAGSTETLNITFSNHCGAYEGQVVDADGKPVPQARTLILLTGTPEDPGDSYIETADEEGRFSYEGMTPGSYKVWAWREADEWDGDLATLRELAPRATVIEFREGDAKSIGKIMVLNPARAGQ